MVEVSFQNTIMDFSLSEYDVIFTEFENIDRVGTKAAWSN